MVSDFSMKIAKGEIEKTAKSGAYVGWAIAILTIVGGIFLGAFRDPFMLIWTLFIVVLVSLLALGIFFKNRGCMVALIVIYMFDTLLLIVLAILSGIGGSPGAVGGAVGSLVIRALFLVLLFKSAKAVFLWHKGAR